MGNPNSYRATNPSSDQIVGLMRRVNALESATSLYTLLLSWGNHGSGDGQFNIPIGIAIDSSGYIYVVDMLNYRIQKFTPTGTFITKWGSRGNGDGQFEQSGAGAGMGDVVIDSVGYVYVCDAFHWRIQKFNAGGTFIAKWGSSGSGNGNFNGIWSIAVDSNDNIYVVDLFNFRIQKFTSTGTFITKWGSQGTGDGQFDFSNGSIGRGGITVDSNDNIYVADAFNSRVQKFTSTGTFIAKWGSQGTGDGQFASADIIAVDSNDNVYVGDHTAKRIQKFTSTGTFLGQWSLVYTPHGIDIDASGYIYISRNNDAIDKYEISVPAPASETTFTRYNRDATASALGTPDGGASIPSLAALNKANNAELDPKHLTDMRTAIQTLAPYYTNAVTGNPFNWTASHADNLYYVAMGDRTKYGATGGAKYTWTRTRAQMLSDGNMYDIDIGEIEECITKLEASALV